MEVNLLFAGILKWFSQISGEVLNVVQSEAVFNQVSSKAKAMSNAMNQSQQTGIIQVVIRFRFCSSLVN